MGRRSKSQRARARQNPRYDARVRDLVASQADGPPAKGRGLLSWRWRLGRFENPAQVGNALHRLKGLSVIDSMELVVEIQEELGDPPPAEIWAEAKKRLKEWGQG